MDQVTKFLYGFTLVMGVMVILFLGIYVVEAVLRVKAWFQNHKRIPVFKMPPIPENIPAPVKPEVINNCSDLIFSNFIKLDCNQDITVLIKAGGPTDDDLFQARIKILSEYYSLTGSKETLKQQALVSKIEALNTKVTQVTALIAFLRMKHMPKLFEALRSWGYSKAFTPESYMKDLQQIETSIKNDRLQLAKAKLRYQDEEDRKSKEGAKAATREGYVKTLIAISNHTKRHIRAEDITTMEYAIMYKELVDYSAAIKAQQ